MTDRAVLVTGASRGIGRAVALAFAAAGDRVAVHFGSDRSAAEAVAANLPGNGHVVLGCDLGDPDAVAAMVDAAVDGLGSLEVLVNNAGVFLAHPVGEVDYDEWHAAWSRTLAVNLLGPANVTYCVARHMVAAGVRGRIVNVGSRGAYRGEPTAPAYAASKAALHAMGQSLAVALAPHGISVTSVAPGFVGTDMARPVLQGGSGDAVRAQSPFGRIAEPEEVAAAVLQLASPGAEWASGAVLDLNGASYLR